MNGSLPMIATDEARSGRILAAFVLFQLCVLTVTPTIVSLSPPIDVVEGGTWAPHWLLGTYKHPPGPAWLLQVMQYIVPGYILGPYFLSQLCVALTYFLVYLTGRQLMDDSRAIAGTLLLAGSYYFTIPTYEFNHNVLQLPVWAGIILTCSCILNRPQKTVFWFILGCLLGVGMYAKYSVAVIAVVTVIYTLTFAAVRIQFLSFRPYLTAAVALTIFAPHIYWLFQNDFSPFVYAASRAHAKGSFLQPVLFALTQLADHVPILLLLAFVGFSALGRSARRKETANSLLFLRLFTFTPILLVTGGALVTGTKLLDMWGMPMFTTVGLWLVAEVRRDWSLEMIRRLAQGAVGIVIFTALFFVGQSLWARSHKPSRPFWPMHELEEKVDALWSAEVKTPLALVGGDRWLAGLVAVASPGHPGVIIGGDLSKSPWITEQDIREKGVLYLSGETNTSPPAYCVDYGAVHKIALSNANLPPVYAIVCQPQSGD
ncbi:glycosyltransferase family 39 protein [Rhizobium sp. ARZ01]|uniref:glycosyltransferase family 39 protein n=1 Tax=Rhizobium sp. ARZ01 TaxID=2769313 RepID=UPI001785E49C|nr:glycosyltransferase family 39 protein [Rhizobium sp. ARZ01]MBD9371908.1 glycosyltransferase family 39 protein [Rhizobium sp. ARZ01]